MKSWCSTQGQRSCPWVGTGRRWGHYHRLTMATVSLTLSNTTVIRSTGNSGHKHICQCHTTALCLYTGMLVCTLNLCNICAATLCFLSWPWCLRSVSWLRVHRVTPAHCRMPPIIPAWRVTAMSALPNHSTKTSRPSPNRLVAAQSLTPCTLIHKRFDTKALDNGFVFVFRSDQRNPSFHQIQNWIIW